VPIKKMSRSLNIWAQTGCLVQATDNRNAERTTPSALLKGTGIFFFMRGHPSFAKEGKFKSEEI
jgi:hypothetical protein